MTWPILSIVATTPLVVVALVAVWRVRRSRLRRRKLRAFVPCERCGYDLRATTGPCPSCGKKRPVVPEAPPAVAPRVEPPPPPPPRGEPTEVEKSAALETPRRSAPQTPPPFIGDDLFDDFVDEQFNPS